MADLVPGARIGEYVIERSLAPRGTGDVYAARHATLRRLATITVQPAADVRALAAIDALDHPGIPRLYERGVLADRRRWTATERIEGRTLAEQLQRGTVSALDAAVVVRDVADILEHAHARRVVHRNLSAENILLADGRPRFPVCLTDWDVAGVLDPGLRGAGDVYALGVVARILLHRACPGTVPPVLAVFIQRMLADGPTLRPTAGEVRDHAGWLANEIEPELAVPQLVDDDLAVVETPPPFQRPITSEIAPNISGEFRRRS